MGEKRRGEEGRGEEMWCAVNGVVWCRKRKSQCSAVHRSVKGSVTRHSTPGEGRQLAVDEFS
jgi:hypothetical protein